MSKKKLLALESTRGIAAVMIVLYHSRVYSSDIPNQFISNAFLFVDMFFVLSGFVMAYSYIDRIKGGLKFKEFTILRFARLYPLHLFTLIAWIPFVVIKYILYINGLESEITTGNIYSFLANLLLLQGFIYSGSWNYPSWSIGVEFYTYLVFYITVFWIYKVLDIKKDIYIFTIFVTILLITYIEFYESNFFRCLWEFFFGIVIYLVINRGITIRYNSLFEVATITAIVYTVYNYSSIYEHIYSVLLFAVLIYLFAQKELGVAGKVFENRYLVYLGTISYSVYMIHALILAIGYKILVYLNIGRVSTMGYIDKGRVVEYGWIVNILFLVFIIYLSSIIYRYIEVKGKIYIIKRFLD